MDRKKAAELAEILVDQMTLEEQASQLRFDAPAIERLGINEYNWWSEGLHGVARAGQATVFPQAIGMAASFDDELICKNHLKIDNTNMTPEEVADYVINHFSLQSTNKEEREFRYKI